MGMTEDLNIWFPNAGHILWVFKKKRINAAVAFLLDFWIYLWKKGPVPLVRFSAQQLVRKAEKPFWVRWDSVHFLLPLEKEVVVIWLHPSCSPELQWHWWNGSDVDSCQVCGRKDLLMLWSFDLRQFVIWLFSPRFNHLTCFSDFVHVHIVRVCHTW